VIGTQLVEAGLHEETIFLTRIRAGATDHLPIEQPNLQEDAIALELQAMKIRPAPLHPHQINPPSLPLRRGVMPKLVFVLEGELAPRYEGRRVFLP